RSGVRRLPGPDDAGEPAERVARPLGLLREMEIRLGEDRLGGASPGGLQRLAGILDPELDLGTVDLQMELESPRALSDPERLHRDVIPGREELAPARELERVLVPVEDQIAVREARDQGVARAGHGRADRREADLAHRGA